MIVYNVTISLGSILMRFVYILFMVFKKRHFQQYFSYMVAVSFIGGGNKGNNKITELRTIL